LLKVGFTNIDAKTRVTQQYPTKRPGPDPYQIVLEESAMRKDGSTFTDREVHNYLRKKGFNNPEGEWFQCSGKEVKTAVEAVKENGYIRSQCGRSRKRR
jgi:hypothetical protein